VENLQQGAFPMVIFEHDTRLDVETYGRYTREFMSALDYGYRPAERVGKYTVFRPAPLDRERPVNFEGGLALVGQTLPPPEVRPGETVSMDVVWQATEPLEETYTSFLHLLDAEGQRYAGDDRQAWDGLYPTTRWAGGEMVRVSYNLTLPGDLPAGFYTLVGGWYDEELDRLRTERDTDQVPLGVVSVVPESEPHQYGRDLLIASFEGGISLMDYDLVHENGNLLLALVWETEAYLEQDYTVFVHLRDAEGETVAQGDGPPLNGAWPTSQWPTGYPLHDVHAIPLPDAMQPGDYRVVVGLWEPATGLRVPLTTGGDELTLDTLSLVWGFPAR
jgi:hypothetical protein